MQASFWPQGQDPAVASEVNRVGTSDRSVCLRSVQVVEARTPTVWSDERSPRSMKIVLATQWPLRRASPTVALTTQRSKTLPNDIPPQDVIRSFVTHDHNRGQRFRLEADRGLRMPNVAAEVSGGEHRALRHTTGPAIPSSISRPGTPREVQIRLPHEARGRGLPGDGRHRCIEWRLHRPRRFATDRRASRP